MLQTGLTAAQLAEKEFDQKYTPAEVEKFGAILKLEEPQRSNAVASMDEAERNRYHEFVKDALNVEKIFFLTLKGDSRRSVIQNAPAQPQEAVTLDLDPDNAQSEASDDEDNREMMVHSDPGVRREKLK